LIKSNKAVLVEDANDLIHHMNWENTASKVVDQVELFDELNETEAKIVELLKETGAIRIDEISMKSGQTINNSATILLGLEFKNIVKSLPGKIYTLNN
jgi:DNA processing protein